MLTKSQILKPGPDDDPRWSSLSSPPINCDPMNAVITLDACCANQDVARMVQSHMTANPEGIHLSNFPTYQLDRLFTCGLCDLSDVTPLHTEGLRDEILRLNHLVERAMAYEVETHTPEAEDRRREQTKERVRRFRARAKTKAKERLQDTGKGPQQ